MLEGGKLQLQEQRQEWHSKWNLEEEDDGQRICACQKSDFYDCAPITALSQKTVGPFSFSPPIWNTRTQTRT
jgi:hypothetical protein